MKKIKHIATVLAAAAVFFLLPGAGCLKAAAEEPVTYAVKYIEDKNEWRYLPDTSTFDDAAYHRELYYMYESMKDGDIVVVYNESAVVPALDLGSVRLSNLSVTPCSSFTIIYSGDVDECNILDGAYCSINANVTNAHIYGTSTSNFNKNIQELRIHANDEITSTVGCDGTVGHLYAPSDTLPRTFYDLYDFKAGSLLIQQGSLETSPDKFSSSPTQPTPAPTEVPQPPAATAPPAASTPSGNDDEYDDVPKTGSHSPVLWLVCIAAASGAVSYGLRRTNQSSK